MKRFDSEILAELRLLEQRKIRPLTELALIPGNPDSMARLKEFEEKIQSLREELTDPRSRAD